MSITTKDKLAFALELGRHTKATVRQVQELLRYAGTLHRLTDTEWGRAKRAHIQRKVKELCSDLAEQRYDVVRNYCTIASNLDLLDAQDLRDSWLEHNPDVDCQIVDMGVTLVFNGAHLKIRVPSGLEITVSS